MEVEITIIQLTKTTTIQARKTARIKKEEKKQAPVKPSPPDKREEKGDKETKKVILNLNWDKRHIRKKQRLCAHKIFPLKKLYLNTQHSELVELTILLAFELVFNDIANLLVTQTNHYVRKDKSNPNFSVSTEEMFNFIGLPFLPGYNIRKCKKDYW